jgi:AcrR family transcriptional regulator
MNATRTARDRARSELTQLIKEEARLQLAAGGPQGLSLRAVARELGMVSSALYRYFRSRDELLTALIIDAYDALGAAAEAAAAEPPRDDVRGRWRAVCVAIRGWARAHPHEYALIYGSPVPGYQAPQDTVAPATRVPLVLIGLVRDSVDAGTLAPALAGQPPSARLTAQAEQIIAEVSPGLPPDALTRIAVAWSQLFGMISFELYGQFTGSFDPTDEFFAYATEQLADFVGVRG